VPKIRAVEVNVDGGVHVHVQVDVKVNEQSGLAPH
jgi:hypothetical protein